MSDQQPIVDNVLLRALVYDAVAREVTNVVAPLRSQLQILDGKLTQFNKDIGAQESKVNRLDALVRGDPQQNLVGLAEQIKQQNVLIEAINKKLSDAEDARAALINQWRGAKYALAGLAIVTGLSSYETLGKLFALVAP